MVVLHLHVFTRIYTILHKILRTTKFGADRKICLFERGVIGLFCVQGAVFRRLVSPFRISKSCGSAPNFVVLRNLV